MMLFQSGAGPAASRLGNHRVVRKGRNNITEGWQGGEPRRSRGWNGRWRRENTSALASETGGVPRR